MMYEQLCFVWGGLVWFWVRKQDLLYIKAKCQACVSAASTKSISNMPELQNNTRESRDIPQTRPLKEVLHC